MPRPRRTRVSTGRPPGRPPGVHTKHARRYGLQTAASWSDELLATRERTRVIYRQLAHGAAVPTGRLEVRTMQLAMQVNQLLERIRALRAGGGC